MKTNGRFALAIGIALTIAVVGPAAATDGATHQMRPALAPPDVPSVSDDQVLAALFGELQISEKAACKFWYENGNTHTNCTCDCFFSGCSTNCEAGQSAKCGCSWGSARCECVTP